MLAQYVMNRNSNRNVYLLTATPFENSPLEVYNIMALMAKKRMEQMGINNINKFFDHFARFESDFVVKHDNTVKEEMKMKQFNNLEELQRLLTEFTDYKSAEDANVPRPEKILKKPLLKMSDLQRQIHIEIMSFMG